MVLKSETVCNLVFFQGFTFYHVRVEALGIGDSQYIIL